MSAVCRIIHLHGGPSDGLCLAWNERVGDTCVTVASASVAFPEYDYIYVPRLAGAAKTRPLSLTYFTHQDFVQPRLWRRLWSAFRVWLLAPTSYPLDMRAYKIPVRSPESSLPQ